MSLARRAVRGATWNVISGIAARVVTVAGTRALTHLLAPHAIGEVTVAVVLPQVGYYSLGYNLADIPTQQAGEHIGDVRVPSFTRLEAT